MVQSCVPSLSGRAGTGTPVCRVPAPVFLCCRLRIRMIAGIICFLCLLLQPTGCAEGLPTYASYAVTLICVAWGSLE